MKYLLPLLLLLGCSQEPHYKWREQFPPSDKVEWRQISWEQVEQMCGWKQVGARTVACAVQIFESKTCYVYSYLTLDQARVSWDLDGISIYDHEMKHCQGWRH